MWVCDGRGGLDTGPWERKKRFLRGRRKMRIIQYMCHESRKEKILWDQSEFSRETRGRVRKKKSSDQGYG